MIECVWSVLHFCISCLFLILVEINIPFIMHLCASHHVIGEISGESLSMKYCLRCLEILLTTVMSVSRLDQERVYVNPEKRKPETSEILLTSPLVLWAVQAACPDVYSGWGGKIGSDE